MSAAPLSERTTPKQIAAYWLNRIRAGDMTIDDVRAFEVWRDRDPSHRAAYLDAERVWELVGGVVDQPAAMASRERNARRFNRPAQARFAGAIAAAVTLIALSGWTIFTSGLLDVFGFGEAPPAQELRTSVGQRTMVTLRDHSIVTLDTDTIVRLRESRRERRVELVQGRAYFQVAKDKQRPFIVAAAGKTVRATGTAFDVRNESDRVEVTLLEGRVRVEEPRREGGNPQSADMRMGWRLVARLDGQPWQMSPIDMARETAWHEGRLSFYRDPLTSAALEMNRYSEKKIVFSGRPPQAVVVGVFRAGDVDGFARALELNNVARITRDSETEVELSAR